MFYIKLSAHHYPTASGFIFVNAETSVPIIVRIMKKYKEYVKQNKIIEHGIKTGPRKLLQVFNNMPDPTGLFHNLLLHIIVDFPTFFDNIQNKGDYALTKQNGKQITLLGCYFKRNVQNWLGQDLKELDSLYRIIWTFPESIINTIAY